MIRHRGATARLHRRRLFLWWAWWRGVRFVASRTGRIAAALDEVWWEEFGTAGAPPPAMQMPLEQARQLLGVPRDYTKTDWAFRRAAMKAIPTKAARRRCSGCWSRPATACWPRSALLEGVQQRQAMRRNSIPGL
jgi:hypothetical protein